MIVNGCPSALLNIGGGRENAFVAQSRVPVKIKQWNHLAFSYDGDSLRLYVNGELSSERKIGRVRLSGHDGLTFGRRQDNSGDGYHFRGALDEIRFCHKALQQLSEMAKLPLNYRCLVIKYMHFESLRSSKYTPNFNWNCFNT